MKNKIKYRKHNRKKTTSKPMFMPLLFIVGFSAGYLYYEGQVPTIFSSETEIPTLNVCFSPEGQCEKLALHAIKSAQQEILVQAYSFTSKPIANELIEASRRGVKVRILFDRSQLKAPYSQIHRLKKAGIQTTVDNVPGIAHNKTIIVDQSRLITGSYNFSKAANSKNAENMLYINNENLAMIYKTQWLRRTKYKTL